MLISVCSLIQLVVNILNRRIKIIFLEGICKIIFLNAPLKDVCVLPIPFIPICFRTAKQDIVFVYSENKCAKQNLMYLI